jgi:hypothetical protein
MALIKEQKIKKIKSSVLRKERSAKIPFRVLEKVQKIRKKCPYLKKRTAVNLRMEKFTFVSAIMPLTMKQKKDIVQFHGKIYFCLPRKKTGLTKKTVQESHYRHSNMCP